MTAKIKVLFICSHNSVRSQIAEGWLRHLYGDRYVAMSAGTHPCGVNPTAVQVMREKGIDISDQRSSHVDDFLDAHPDYIVTLCDRAHEKCPTFSGGGVKIHKSTYDPGTAEGSEAFVLQEFRRIRDELGEWIEEEFGR